MAMKVTMGHHADYEVPLLAQPKQDVLQQPNPVVVFGKDAQGLTDFVDQRVIEVLPNNSPGSTIIVDLNR
jgi:hypothetical protein